MTLSEWAARVAAEYRLGRPLVLLFDYGGTLTLLASHPSLAALPAATRDALAALAGLNGVTVAVLSGRTLTHLRELVGLTGVWYAGSAGMHLDLGGVEVIDPALAEFDRVADPLVMALSEPVRSFPGAWVERKPGCLAVHYRALAHPQAASFLELVRNVLADLGDDCPPLRVREATLALEIALAGSWTKGIAVDRMLRAWGREPFVVYAGDGANDVEAVDLVNTRGGLTVGVGPEPPTGACVLVPAQEDFAADLSRLAIELSPTPTATLSRFAG